MIMSNSCDNKFYFRCEDNFSDWKNKLKKLICDNFTNDYKLDIDEFDYTIEGWFSSHNIFPEELFQQIFPDDDSKAFFDDVYFRCLSEEYGNEYVSMHIYSDGDWHDPQYFDL